MPSGAVIPPSSNAEMPNRFYLSHSRPVISGLARHAGTTVHTFLDEQGESWDVCELEPPPGTPWAKGPHFLLFESGPVARRVWRYPPDWATLDDGALSRLKDQL